MRICITGGLGHIGSFLISHNSSRSLADRHDITIVDNLSTERYCSTFNLPPHAIRLKLDDVKNCPLSFFGGFDLIVHLAAITDATSSFEREAETTENNLSATRHVAKACLENNVPMIFASSTSVYGPNTDEVFESDVANLNPHSPYAKVKLEEEKYLQELAVTDGLQCLIFRLGTIHGVSNGMRFHTAVNKFCWQAATGIPLTIWSTAMHQKRPYLSLSDFARLLDFLPEASLDFQGEIYNVVTGHYSPAQIAQIIADYLKKEINTNIVESEVMNQHSYVASTLKVEAAGFSFKGSLERDVAQTLDILQGLY